MQNEFFIVYKHCIWLGSMIQVGCRLWNLSLLSVVVLTICNILLTIRLLHWDCPPTILPESLPRLHPPPVPPHLHESIVNTCSTCNVTNGIFGVDTKLGRWDSRHLFKMFDFTVVGDIYPELSEKHLVCIATQSSLEKLHSLIQVAHHWSGPISTALYAAGDQEYKLLQGYVAFLRRCYKPIRDRVTFHLLLPKDKLPRSNIIPEKTDHFECLHPEIALTHLVQMRSSDIVRWRMRNPYPQNHMRNLARRNCQTPYVFLTDVDIIPSTHLTEGLNAFLKNVKCAGLCAYVIPTYELDERVRFPRNKTDLIRLTNKGLAQPFHHKVFIYNQFATNFSRWEDDLSEIVHISHNVTNFEFLYEPFYVAPDIAPGHDERFIGYGFTRNTQVYEMYVAGYQFYVLSPVFTCHWGLQTRKGRPFWREKQNSANRRNFDVFKREVFARYRKDPLHMVQQTYPNQNKKSLPIKKN
uniref:Beta-1,4-glucuronyltransferase 1 n=1 Tax=Clastoptera arizonana TaxID=38151 RepID=A0A1B6D9Z2_9HEMI